MVLCQLKTRERTYEDVDDLLRILEHLGQRVHVVVAVDVPAGASVPHPSIDEQRDAPFHEVVEALAREALEAVALPDLLANLVVLDLLGVIVATCSLRQLGDRAKMVENNTRFGFITPGGVSALSEGPNDDDDGSHRLHDPARASRPPGSSPRPRRAS